MTQSELEIRFYHLQQTPVDGALMNLLSVCVQRGWNALVVSDNDVFLQNIDDTLWQQDGFIPHAIIGKMNNGDCDSLNPILLGNTVCDINTPYVLFLLHGVDTDDFAGASVVCHLFDGQEGESVDFARNLWKKYGDGGHYLTYWQQENKTWVKKSEFNVPSPAVHEKSQGHEKTE